MKSLAKILLITALSIGVPTGIMAQSVGNTDPAKADTTDPGSTPKAKSAKKGKTAKTTEAKHKGHKEDKKN